MFCLPQIFTVDDRNLEMVENLKYLEANNIRSDKGSLKLVNLLFLDNII